MLRPRSDLALRHGDGLSFSILNQNIHEPNELVANNYNIKTICNHRFSFRVERAIVGKLDLVVVEILRDSTV